MAEQGGIDGRDLCSSVKNMNGVLLANIKGIGGRDRTACASCAEVNLSENRERLVACATACDATYYTDGDPTNLQVGDFLFTDSSCTTTSGRNYYSNKCGGRSGNAYLLDPSGKIISVSTC
tara:strand:+ start:957 stop:1319 length:363 start_codon:yes stop_codon:yes gene_type:complete